MGVRRESHPPHAAPPVRLLPGVCPQVSREVRGSGEDLPAVPGGGRLSGDPETRCFLAQPPSNWAYSAPQLLPWGRWPAAQPGLQSLCSPSVQLSFTEKPPAHGLSCWGLPGCFPPQTSSQPGPRGVGWAETGWHRLGQAGAAGERHSGLFPKPGCQSPPRAIVQPRAAHPGLCLWDSTCPDDSHCLSSYSLGGGRGRFTPNTRTWGSRTVYCGRL